MSSHDLFEWMIQYKCPLKIFIVTLEIKIIVHQQKKENKRNILYTSMFHHNT